jgi:hypothetical protein
MFDPTQGEFRQTDDGFEFWQDGELVASGDEATVLFEKWQADQEAAARKEAQRPSNILRFLSDKDAAKLLDLAGIPHSGK